MSQTFKEFYDQLDEGFIRNLASGALLGASLLGGVNHADAASKSYTPTITQSINQSYNANAFAYYWSKFYNAENSSKFNWAKAELNTRTSMPSPRLMQSINKAVKCFAGDEGLDAHTLKQLLILTGRLETNYTGKLESSGKACGYWQCLATTARDRLHNGKAYFGNNFRKMFGKNALQQFQKLSIDQLREKLKNDPDFCALIAAAKWVEIAHNNHNKRNKCITSIFK